MGKRALLIGLNEYHTLGKLRYARQDAESIAMALRRYCDFSDLEITLMSCTSRGAELGLARYIEKALIRLAECRELELLIFGFWGHGFASEGKRYLCGVDTEEDDLIRTAVSLEVVKAKLAQVQAENTLLVLDCCQNRPAGRSAAAEPMMQGEEEALASIARDIRASRQKQSLKSIPTVAIINSCREGQKAYEWDERGHGIFTAYLLEALNKGYGSVATISAWTAERVTRKAADLYDQQQIPFITIEGKGDIRLIEDSRREEEDRSREAQRRREERRRSEEVRRKEEVERAARIKAQREAEEARRKAERQEAERRAVEEAQKREEEQRRAEGVRRWEEAAEKKWQGQKQRERKRIIWAIIGAFMICGFILITFFNKPSRKPKDFSSNKKISELNIRAGNLEQYKINFNDGQKHRIDFNELSRKIDLNNVQIFKSDKDMNLISIQSADNYLENIKLFYTDLDGDNEKEIICAGRFPLNIFEILKKRDEKYIPIFKKFGADGYHIQDIRDLNKDDVNELIFSWNFGNDILGAEIVWWDKLNQEFNSVGAEIIEGIWDFDKNGFYEIEVLEYSDDIITPEYTEDMSAFNMRFSRPYWYLLVRWNGYTFKEAGNNYPHYYKSFVIPTYEQEIKELKNEINKSWAKIAVSNREKLIFKAKKLIGEVQ